MRRPKLPHLPGKTSARRRRELAWIFAVIFAASGAAPPAQARQVPFGTERLVALVNSTAVFHADVDGDGDVDVLSASFAGNSISWFENNGAGFFGGRQVISTLASGALSVFAADVDGDGDLDALSASQGNDTIAWHANTDGDGSFGSQQVISTAASGAASVFAADLDRDGDLDVLSASRSDNTIAWYTNTDGAGTFGSRQVISTLANGALSVFAADMDGDGDLDVLSASPYDFKIAMYENTDGAGTFAAQKVISNAVNGASSVFAADVDGDGDADVLSAGLYDDTIGWHENFGDYALGVCQFQTPPCFVPRQVISSVADGARSVFAADIDADGDLDALSASLTDGTIAWHENTDGTGTFGPEQVLSTAAPAAGSVAATDLDGDGDLDVLFGSSGKTGWFRNETIHRSAHFPEQALISTGVTYVDSASAADVDGDGDFDVVSTASGPTAGTSSLAWYENVDGSGTFGPQQVISTAARDPQPIAAADIDGDGDVDLLAASRSDDTIGWWKNVDGEGSFGSLQVISSLVGQPLSVAAADIDGDGDLDVLSGSTTSTEQITGKTILWWENTDGAGSFGSHQLVASQAFGASSTAAADVDHDGDLDVISGDVAWWEHTDGAGTFGPKQTISSESAWKVLAADLDGDGDLDVLGIRSVFGVDSVRWWENTDGNGTFGATQLISTLVDSPTSVFAADLDLDGDLDVLSSSWEDDKLAWYENDGSGAFGPQRVISALVDTPGSMVPADLDGDGDFDLLFPSLNDATIAWYENRGGQFALTTTDVAQKVVANGELQDLLRIELIHRGRSGDSPLELATLELRLTDSAGTPLTESRALALFQTVRVYLDSGSGSFDASDTLVASLSDFSSITTNGDGVLTMPFSDGDANVRVDFGSPKSYFVVVQMTANAGSQTPSAFAVEHRTESSSTAEDARADIPLTLEFAANIGTGAVDTQLTTASCRAPFDLELANRTVATTVVCEAGTVLTAGNSVTVVSPGNLTFRAGQKVQLLDEFSVQSGAFSAEIDPALKP